MEQSMNLPYTMNALTLQERIDNYCRVTGYPRSIFIGDDGRIVGTWIMGNDYRVKSNYYGGYPAGYLKRMKGLFPDCTERTESLHLFSGKVDQSIIPGMTVDINSRFHPDFVDDAQRLETVPVENIRFVWADPPYSVEDAEHYQTTMIKRNVVMSVLGERLPVGAYVIWLDQVLPMYRKSQFCIDGVIGMVKSTNHRFRVITIFRRV
jgi:hypothetical protein